jgi:hypothetical protein
MRPNFLTKDSLYTLSEEEKKFIKESREVFLKGNVWELLQYRPKIFKYLSEIVLEKRIDFLKQLFAYSSTWTFYTLQWVCEAMVEAFKITKETVKNDPILHTQVVGILYEMKGVRCGPHPHPYRSSYVMIIFLAPLRLFFT